mmetsp:Transcript_11207/g.25872  ORF Transcript_11207/g.25872 Transcript_11207/m.25872 type:complete len:121 (-) Transcript_11207:556-918(-)
MRVRQASGVRPNPAAIATPRGYPAAGTFAAFRFERPPNKLAGLIFLEPCRPNEGRFCIWTDFFLPPPPSPLFLDEPTPETLFLDTPSPPLFLDPSAAAPDDAAGVDDAAAGAAAGASPRL